MTSTTSEPRWAFEGPATIEALRAVRQLLDAADDAADQADASRGAAASPLTDDDLPRGLRDLLDRYRDEHPGRAVVPVRLLTTGPAGRATGGSGGLPELGDLLTLAVTTSAIHAGMAQVHSDVLLASLTGEGDRAVNGPQSLGGVAVDIQGPDDRSMPLVVLLHGLGGTSTDMTDPITSRGNVAYDRTVVDPPYSDAGVHFHPPLVPVAGVRLDPPLPAVRSWQTALTAAGFSTLVYTQSGPTLAADAAELAAVARALAADPDFTGRRFAIVAHSRGGLVARAFLTAAAGDSTLAGFLARTPTLVTLHTPHLGSGVADLSVTVDGLLAVLQAAFATLGPAPGVLAMLRSMVTSPAIAELTTTSPVLAGIAAAEPVAGIAYHSFGGTSTHVARVKADLYTPDSGIPLPVPFPLFHWGTTPIQAGTLLDPVTFTPAAFALPVPPLPELVLTTVALAGTTPELVNGAGDLLVTDARARLPFSTHTTNPLNHAEALWAPALQTQVVSVLARLRTPGVSGRAVAQLSPYPVTAASRAYTVTARDAVTGTPLPDGLVTVFDTFGAVALKVPLGTTFSYAFKGRRQVTVDPQTHQRLIEVFHPSVGVQFPPPYAPVDVDTGAGSL